MKKIFALMLMLMAGSAQAITVEMVWTGVGGYTAVGTFSYADSLDGTGVITSSSIGSFSIEAFQGSTSLFTWDLSEGTGSTPFQFSFDTTAFDIVKGGLWPTATDSVHLGVDTTRSLACGTASCGLFIGGGFYGYRGVGDTQFAFTRVAVPEATTLMLLSFGLLGLGFGMKRKTA